MKKLNLILTGAGSLLFAAFVMVMSATPAAAGPYSDCIAKIYDSGKEPTYKDRINCFGGSGTGSAKFVLKESSDNGGEDPGTDPGENPGHHGHHGHWGNHHGHHGSHWGHHGPRGPKNHPGTGGNTTSGSTGSSESGGGDSGNSGSDGGDGGDSSAE